MRKPQDKESCGFRFGGRCGEAKSQRAPGKEIEQIRVATQDRRRRPDRSDRSDDVPAHLRHRGGTTGRPDGRHHHAH